MTEILCSAVASAVIMAGGASSAHVSRPEPWTVIDQPERQSFDLLFDPQIVALSSGVLVACVDHTGHYASCIGSYVYRSTDHGMSWKRVLTVEAADGVRLFEANGSVYVYWAEGTDYVGTLGEIVLRRSDDAGSTWTGSDPPRSGKISGTLRVAPCVGRPVVSGGRVWGAFHRLLPSAARGRSSQLLLASAPLDLDLMDPLNWTWSEALSLPEGGWEFSFLASFGGSVPVLVCRSFGVECWPWVDVSPDGCLLRVRSGPGRTTPSIRPCMEAFPFDSKTRLFYGLSQPETGWAGGLWTGRVNLATSRDLECWEDRSDLLLDIRNPGMQFGWMDLDFDGDDLVAILCVDALDAGKSDRISKVLFLRVPDFRRRTAQDPPLWESGR